MRADAPIRQRVGRDAPRGTGSGTPGYISPEQAAGELHRLSPHSDVYSLGATLDRLLTGKPPFQGTHVGWVLRAVQEGDFPPPRRLNVSLDRALEAVCMKAMAKCAIPPLPIGPGAGR